MSGSDLTLTLKTAFDLQQLPWSFLSYHMIFISTLLFSNLSWNSFLLVLLMVCVFVLRPKCVRLPLNAQEQVQRLCKAALQCCC